MNTLIIHPSDPSTEFLEVAYRDMPDKTLVTGDLAIDEVRGLIPSYDRVLMCGHGSPSGLFSVGRFWGTLDYIVNETFATHLRTKANNIFIWWYADQFVNRHGLTGFYSGMFISETGEAMICGLRGITPEMVDESNLAFCMSLARYMNEDAGTLYSNVTREYGMTALRNPVARYNHQRLFANL
jgi:hypothetical protein